MASSSGSSSHGGPRLSQTSLDQHLLSVQQGLLPDNGEVTKKELQSKLVFPNEGGNKKEGGSLNTSLNNSKKAKKTPTKSKQPATKSVTNEQLQMAFIKMIENAKTTQQSNEQHSSSTTLASTLASTTSGSGTGATSGLSIPLLGQNELSRLLSNASNPLSHKVSPNKQHRIPKKSKATTAAAGGAGSSSGSGMGVKKRGHSLCTLPSNRVRMLMKTTPNVVSISQEAITVTSKAAELFISKLIRDSLAMSKEDSSDDTITSKEITYSHLAQSIKRNPQQLKFLKDFVPMKVKAKDYLTTQKLSPGNSNSN